MKQCNNVISMRRCCFIILSLFNYYIATMSMAGNPANYNVVPLPQSIVEQKGEAFVLEHLYWRTVCRFWLLPICRGRLSSCGSI